MRRYWYLSNQPHVAEFPAWLRNHLWLVTVTKFDERVRPGDVIFIGNHERGIFAWGTLSAVPNDRRDGNLILEISRGDISQSLVSSEQLAEIEELSRLIRAPVAPFTFMTDLQVRRVCDFLNRKPPSPSEPQYIRSSKVDQEEGLFLEYKQVALSQIAKEAYEFAVAYASRGGGKVIFGIGDDGSVVGMELDLTTRDKLKKQIEDKLSSINPPLHAFDDYTLDFRRVVDNDGNETTCYVLELEVKSTGNEHATAGGKAYHKTYSGKRRRTLKKD